MFIDEVTVTVKSGAGGDGCMSFRREKFIPRGGPDGGNGGDGGRVILRSVANLSTLVDFRYRSRIEAGRGGHGKGKDLTGARGDEAVLRVPPGTVVRDDATGEFIADLAGSDQEFVLLKGGRGGRGNARFATSTNQAPRRADPGAPGEERIVRLELKLLADVGLVGFPNAGKSTLLSRLSAAHPKIADYPFTTLQPNLGIVRFGDYDSFVLADLPGLIEGAHQGKGLGIRFLRHIERTRVLLFTLEATDETPEQQFEALRDELRQFDPGLLEKPFAVAWTKADLLGPDPEAPASPEGAGEAPCFLISSVSGHGLAPLLRWLGESVVADRALRQQDTEPDES
ncbi:MAG: GTPase ObgE [Candidatus Latescibacteria bacterium]|jgi:GTP-binding protein|nr:GTPase ObgE [Gemmatimonadaceae bacterium]MDP6015661.1 GTPase ObgE [Candidatus Latescibacterota bacterium]MDP7448944.1 GTPase ObgE [Candidatus Latescibacterota bacterium]HJP30034.1 GTPase ObgE [Candidatus Latescibacterota bacterium]